MLTLTPHHVIINKKSQKYFKFHATPLRYDNHQSRITRSCSELLIRIGSRGDSIHYIYKEIRIRESVDSRLIHERVSHLTYYIGTLKITRDRFDLSKNHERSFKIDYEDH